MIKINGHPIKSFVFPAGEVNGKGIDIYKDPKTDDGTKKSAKGLLMVSRSGNTYELYDQCTPKQEDKGCLETVFKNGTVYQNIHFDEIRERIIEEMF